jgi:radical SAM superfamily enzyme YgiQ (UPF0313 family)
MNTAPHNNDFNLLLIYPPYGEGDTLPDVPPLGLAYLASFARSRLDINVTVWDLNLNRINKDEFRNNLLKLKDKPSIIGIGGIVTVINPFLWMSKICKEIFPDALLIAGGSLGSTVAHLLFKYSPVDLCVKGEGEFTLLEIINSYRTGAGKQDMNQIAGLLLWDDNKQNVTETAYRSRSRDLDEFGLPAYNLIDVPRYARNGILNLRSGYRDLQGILDAESLVMPIMTSRGCTSNCSFCYRQFPNISMNSASFVEKHIEFLNQKFGINVFSIIDELFNMSEKRINEMISCFGSLKQRIGNLHFRICGARVDCIETAYLKKLKELGCFQIIYGLESGSQKMLDSMHKRVTVGQNRNAVLAAKEAGLSCVPQFVIGLPGEDEKTLRETFSFIESIDFWPDIGLHNANAYPGSAIYKYAQEKGLIMDELSYVSSLAATDSYPLSLGNISEREMHRMVRRFLIRRIFRKNNFFKAVLIIAGMIKRKIFRN